MGFRHEKETALVKKLCNPVHSIIKLQMFDELKSLLTKDSLRLQENAGRALDLLKNINYFADLDSRLGSEYLLTMLPLIHPFILREGFSLINQNDLYVHVWGDLRSQQARFEGNRVIQAGKWIDLRDNHNLTFKAFNDCNLMRIQRSAGVMNQTQKKLQQMERQHTKKMKDYLKTVVLPQNHIKLDIIEKSSFFSVLGDYDRYEFALGCNMKQYSQYMQTHQKSDRVSKIGYIVSGKIKMTMTDGDAHRKSKGIYWFSNEDDWIGLEEYLWDKSQQSSGQVQTIAAIILWIPHHLFQNKFNLRTNYSALSNLSSLIKTKRLLFERSVNCRKKKQAQIEIQHNAKLQLNPDLKAKVQALQAYSVKRKTHFSHTKFQSSKRDIPIPDQILHKAHNLTDELLLLPRLEQKTIVLFPQEYANSPVNPSYKKEINRLKSIINKQKQKQHYKTLDLNPEGLYQTIYQRIAFKYPSKHGTRGCSPPRRVSQGKSTQHFNSSIYNNFKISKQILKETISKNKTLSILPYSNY